MVWGQVMLADIHGVDATQFKTNLQERSLRDGSRHKRRRHSADVDDGIKESNLGDDGLEVHSDPSRAALGHSSMTKSGEQNYLRVIQHELSLLRSCLKLLQTKTGLLMWHDLPGLEALVVREAEVMEQLQEAHGISVAAEIQP